MSVTLTADGRITLLERCDMAEAEALHSLLALHPAAVVDWRGCTYAHAAVVQVLLAAQPRLEGPPAGDFLRTFLAGALLKKL
jgi:hypothetical protein